MHASWQNKTPPPPPPQSREEEARVPSRFFFFLFFSSMSFFDTSKHLERECVTFEHPKSEREIPGLDWKREREREREGDVSEDDAPKRSDDRRRGNDGVVRTGSRIRGRAGRRVRRRRQKLWRVRRMSREARTPNTTVVECIIIIPVVVVVVVFGPDVRRVGENVRFGGSLSRVVYRDRPAATAVSW